MRRLLRAGITGIVLTSAGAAPAAPDADPHARHELALELERNGDYTRAIAAIDEALPAARGELLRQLLHLKGEVLVKRSDYTDAIAAYQAFLAAGARGGDARDVRLTIANLHEIEHTRLEVSLANGPATIYLDSADDAALCQAAPSCVHQLRPGGHTLIADRPGFQRWTAPITAARNQTVVVAVTLVETPSPLTVRVTPADARVTIDDAPYTAPASLAAGPHRVAAARAPTPASPSPTLPPSPQPEPPRPHPRTRGLPRPRSPSPRGSARSPASTSPYGSEAASAS